MSACQVATGRDFLPPQIKSPEEIPRFVLGALRTEANRDVAPDIILAGFAEALKIPGSQDELVARVRDLIRALDPNALPRG